MYAAVLRVCRKGGPEALSFQTPMPIGLASAVVGFCVVLTKALGSKHQPSLIEPGHAECPMLHAHTSLTPHSSLEVELPIQLRLEF